MAPRGGEDHPAKPPRHADLVPPGYADARSRQTRRGRRQFRLRWDAFLARIRTSEPDFCTSPATLETGGAECSSCFEPLCRSSPVAFVDGDGHEVCPHFLCVHCARSYVASATSTGTMLRCPECRRAVAVASVIAAGTHPMPRARWHQLLEARSAAHPMPRVFWQQFCEHGRGRTRCRECCGIGFCKHCRRRTRCRKCDGNRFSEHDRRRTHCHECGGRSFSEHGRRRTRCRDRGGNRFCDHGRRRTQCRDCGGIRCCGNGKGRTRCRE